MKKYISTLFVYLLIISSSSKAIDTKAEQVIPLQKIKQQDVEKLTEKINQCQSFN